MTTPTRGTQTRDTNTTTTSNTNDRSGSTSQTRVQTNQSDRERPVESSRERGREGVRENGRQTGTNVQRHGGTAPTLGGATNPFVMMRRMADEMDRVFEQFGFPRTGTALSPRLGAWLDDDPWTGRGAGTGRGPWTPQMETLRRGDRIVVRADIPGVQKDDVHVEVDDGVLTISGERRDAQEDERDGYYRSERSYGQFYRTIPLPEGVDAEKCEASFKDGVLEVSLPAPKQEERKARRIQIR